MLVPAVLPQVQIKCAKNIVRYPSNGAPHWQRMPVSNGVAIVRTNGARPAILIRTGPVLQGWAGIGHDSLRAFPISAVIFRAAHRIRVRV